MKPLITATFTDLTSGGLSGTPTISMDTAPTTNMSSTANPLVWTYNGWTVPSGTDGTSYALSITASDKAGNPNAAATGVTSYTLGQHPAHPRHFR